ncbi:MAG: YidC/Oxa1 family membrane protein insertase [Candidatus Paceibacterota bacterium]|jgi:YidC/Oxa1 family membrane protein insertase
MSYIFNTFFYAPLYNGLIFFIAVIPWHNVGFVVVAFTLLIKAILFPLSQKSVETQFKMKQLEPDLEAIKQKYKDNKQMQAEKTMQFYKEKSINPFSGILLMFIQLPVLLALYYVFLKGGLPDLNHTLLYSFTKVPEAINMVMFGINVADKSIVLAILAAVTQFLQMQIMMPKVAKKDPSNKTAPQFKDELARSMNMQMKYVMPVIIFFIAKSFPAVVSLYLITSSIFAIGQEFYVKRKRR